MFECPKCGAPLDLFWDDTCYPPDGVEADAYCDACEWKGSLVFEVSFSNYWDEEHDSFKKWGEWEYEN